MICCGIWGNDKSGKSSLALSFPKPIHHFEFDLGGYDRAIRRFTKERDDGLITSEPFIIGNMNEVTIKQSKIIVGAKELWYEFLVKYLRFLNDKDIITGVIDTGTLLYNLDCDAFLQEKQEIQFDSKGNLLPNERLRAILQPPEYREPNTRMRGIIYQAKAHGKNLVLVHHSRDEYKSTLDRKTGEIKEAKTGEKERSGFASLGDSTDLMLHTYTKQNRETKATEFYCKVDEQSVPPGLVGMEFENPTYDKIMDATRMIQGE